VDKTTREKLHGIRYPHKADPQLVAGSKEAWEWLKGRRADCVAAGCILTAEPEFSDALTATIDSYQQPEPPSTLNVEQELYRLTIAMQEGSAAYQFRSISMKMLVGLWGRGDGPGVFNRAFSERGSLCFSGSLRRAPYCAF
jgi:hypothetical protein